MRLVEPSTKSAMYATLSYCWGGDQRMKTARDNFEQWKVDIPVQELPATIKDAAETALQLNIRYLYVDAFCIIQDDAETWRTNLHKCRPFTVKLQSPSLIRERRALAKDFSIQETLCPNSLIAGTFSSCHFVVQLEKSAPLFYFRQTSPGWTNRWRIERGHCRSVYYLTVS
jgi:hypothetical protein